MDNYIDSVTTDLDRDKLKTLMNSLYNEAIDEEIQWVIKLKLIIY